MRAGRLKHRLRLQQGTRSQDSHGDYSTTWNTMLTVWGALEAIRGKEATSAGQEVGEVLSKVVIRFSDAVAGIDTNWRIQDVRTGKNYAIDAVLPGDELPPYRRMIEMTVRQGQPDND